MSNPESSQPVPENPEGTASQHNAAMAAIESLTGSTDIKRPEEIQDILFRSWVLGEDTSEGVDLDDKADQPPSLYVPEKWTKDSR